MEKHMSLYQKKRKKRICPFSLQTTYYKQVQLTNDKQLNFQLPFQVLVG